MKYRLSVAVLLIAIIVLVSGCTSNTAPGTTTSPYAASQQNAPVKEEGVQETPAEPQSIVTSNNMFSVELYKELSQSSPGKNLLFSPVSIFTALSMTYEGARGQTEVEMRKVLHLPENASLRWNAFRNMLTGLEEPSSGETVRIADALWIQQGFPIREGYLDIVKKYYLGNVTALDFRNNPMGAVARINRWVYQQTDGKIQNLIGGLTPATRMVITNTVYFNANWTHRFNPADTHNGTFFEPSGGHVIVPMMHETGRFNYTETDELQAIELPYGDGKFSMVIILPRSKNLTGVESKLSPEFLSNITSSMKPQNVSVTLPKFRFEAKYHLKNPLIRMGMGDAFNPKADFSGISPNDQLNINDVIHKTFISVGENGTEAAAATAVIITAGCAPGEQPEYKVFKADHPFLFLIVDRNSGLILFIGRLENPRG